MNNNQARNEETELKVNSTEGAAQVNELELIEELQVIESAELTVGHAFHAFRFSVE